MVVGKKKISRRKPGDKPFKNYFDEDTQVAIVAFRNTTDYGERSKLYVDVILPAFDKLIENLIHVYGFHVMFESNSDLKNECLEFMFGVITKFNPERGSKAFSYFNVVARNWLMIKGKQNSKNLASYISLDNKDAMTAHELAIIQNHDIAPSVDDIIDSEEFNKNLRAMVAELKNRAKTDNENACLEAISVIIENIDDIDLLSKRAVMCYIREITKMSSKQLSIVLSSLKKQYRQIKEENHQR